MELPQEAPSTSRVVVGSESIEMKVIGHRTDVSLRQSEDSLSPKQEIEDVKDPEDHPLRTTSLVRNEEWEKFGHSGKLPEDLVEEGPFSAQARDARDSPLREAFLDMKGSAEALVFTGLPFGKSYLSTPLSL